MNRKTAALVVGAVSLLWTVTVCGQRMYWISEKRSLDPRAIFATLPAPKPLSKAAKPGLH